MEKAQLTSGNFPGLALSEFKHYSQGWLLDCEMRQHSAGTLALRRLILEKFTWFLAQRELSAVNTLAVRHFLVYVANGHKEPGGRWGDERNTYTARRLRNSSGVATWTAARCRFISTLRSSIWLTAFITSCGTASKRAARVTSKASRRPSCSPFAM